MTDQNKKLVDGGSVVPAVVAVTAAVVGVGIGIAGAVAMSDKDTREKVKNGLNDAKHKVDKIEEAVRK